MASARRTISRNGSQIKRAVAYARFSSTNQREESIDAQIRAIREYCERNGIQLVAIFTDEAISGKSDKRDDFQKMVQGVIKGRYDVDAILVHKFNRFARNKYDSALYKKRLKEVGVRVISVTQNIDDTPEGELLEGFLETIDQYYSANLAVEVRKGLRENALKGKHAGGQVPFGYSLDKDGYYVPNENAKIVRRIFEEYAAGIPKTEICERLNKEGYVNQRGKKFNTRTIYDMLRNPKYIGIYIYTIDRKETIRLDDVIENPPIDRKLWDKVQKMCQEGSNKGRYRKQKKQYYLTGKLHCGVCGSTISGGGSKRSRGTGPLNYYYKCSGKTKQKNGCDNPSINKDWFEPRVMQAVVNTVMSEEKIKHIAKLAFEELEAMRERPTVSTASLKKELSQIKVQQAKLMEVYLDPESGMDKEMLDERNNAFKSRKYEIEEELKKRAQVIGTDDITEEAIAAYLAEYIEHIKESYTAEDDEFMRAIFANFVEKVVVDKEKCTVHVAVDFSTADGAEGGANRWLSGVNHLIPTVKFRVKFRRKPMHARINDY